MKNYLHLTLKYTLLVLLISISNSLFAQNGDCSCVNCPQPVQDNGTFGAILNVNIDGPNDLSLCNLEQVCFQINHTWIGDFSVSLQAPDGTEYMLMGDNDNNNNSGCGNTQDNLDVCIDIGTTNPLTNNSPYVCNGGNPCLTGNWTVPCGITAPTTTGVFPVGFGLTSNPQVAPNCDLNDFNTPGSPASGQWVLFTHDYCSADVGTIIDFSLEFSCPTLFCGDCSADAGIINQPNIDDCFGSPNLNLNITPIYVPANTAPDPTEYSYTFAVTNAAGTITQFIMGPNLSAVPPGNYTVCGISYLTTDAGTLNTYIGQTIANLEDGIANGLICADVSDSCFDVLIGPPLPPIIVMETLCAGDCYTDPNGGQCCWPVPTCSYFTPTGSGCDQETIVQFTWTPPVMTQDQQFVCEDDCVIIDGMSYCAPGPHLLNLMTFDGCDSIVTLLVTEVPIDAIINPANPEVSCSIPTVVLDGSPSNADTYEWTDPDNVNIGNGPQVTVSDPGIYTLEVTVTSNGITCTDIETVTVVETSALPQMPSLTGLLIACDGDVFTYTTIADPEATDYIWTIPADATIVFGGNGSNQATIDWDGSNGGQVCVEVTNDCGSGGQDCINIVVNDLPATPDIFGDDVVCFGGMGNYCVTPDPDDDSYTWQVPPGAIILTGQGSPCITVDFNTAMSGSVCVNAVNDCGNSLQDCFPITFGNPPADVTVSGDDLVCPGDAVIYTATIDPNADTYVWNIPACATILAGDGTNEITVLWEVACAAAGDVCVFAQNGCGDGLTDCLPVMFDASPPLPNIFGPDAVCENDIDNYNILTDPSITNIVWEVTGGTLNTGQGTPDINVTWGTQGVGTVCVTVTAGCGSSDQACLFVEINALPTAPDIVGPDSGCTDSQLVFSLADGLATGETVTWSTTCGDILAGAGTDEITVEIGPGANCEICATTSTSCGFSQEICLPFTITSTPGTPIIMGDTEFCGCVTSTYTTALDPSATDVVWTVPADATIQSGQGTGEVVVDWCGSVGGDVCVEFGSSCGVASGCLTVAVGGIPTADFTAESPICIDDSSTITYTGSAVASATYVWDFGGGTIVSGSDAGPYEIEWSTAGTYTISLVIDQGGCLSLPFTQNVVVQNTLTPPVVMCNADITSVTFDWADVIDADSYMVNILFGNSGTMTGNTYTVDGLTAGDSIAIEVIAISGNECPDVSTIASCVAQNCPMIDIVMPTVADICIDATTTSIDLDATLSGDNGMGSEVWTGDGVTDTNTGMFDPTLAMLGPNTILYEYTEGTCIYNSSVIINVNTTPTANFTATSPICVDTVSVVTYTGTGTSAATYAWDFNGGNIVSGTNAGPYEISWDTPGTYNISLQVEENGCTSTTETQMVQVDPALIAPTISCNTGTDFIEFTWPDVVGADGYNVTVVQGETGTLNGNSYLVNGLMPNDTVAITLEIETSSACGNITTSVFCVANDCPTIEFDIAPVADICLSDNPGLITLAWTSDQTITGEVTWEGSCITEPFQGIFDPMLANIGANEVTLTYVEGDCNYSESIFINVFDAPTSDFGATTPICVTDNSMVVYLGDGDSNDTYDWDFDSGVIVSGSGDGPYEINWATAGTYTISLTVTSADGCISDPATQTVQVDPVILPPTISCNTGTDFIEFTWPDVTGADGYNVTVVQGETGTLDGNSYLVNGLMPGDTVAITLGIETSSACGDISTSTFCIANDCPEIEFFIGAVPDICLNENPGLITLAWTSDQTITGEVTWEGSCITDPVQGIFDPMLANIGANEVTLTYVEGNCNYSESIIINVFDAPTPDFGVTSPICVTEQSTVVYLGNGSSNDTYDWDFDSGVIVSGSGNGPYEINWAMAGTYTISLIVTSSDGCVSDIATQIVQVDPLLVAPVVNCIAETNQVEFIWEQVANADSYSVVVLSGATGAMSSDTSYLVTGLSVNDMVSIQVTTESANACPGVFTLENCQALDCPDITVAIDAVADICLTPNAPTFNLNAVVTGSNGSGTGVWAGDGIIDATNGTFDINTAGAGPVNITYTFSEVGCDYIASTDFMIFATPSSDFTADVVICETDINTVSYTGTATSAATYTWDFDGGTIISGSGAGPYDIQWVDAGTYTISLMVEENGCMSGTFEQVVQVDQVLIAPVVDCSSTTSSIEFSWDAVANATDYTINVISGPSGTQNTATSYLVENLAPGQSVTIEVIANSSNACPSLTTETTCNALNCPPVNLTIDPLGPFCFDNFASQEEVIFTITGGDISNVTWEGVTLVGGIPGFNANQQPGTYDITMNYQDDNCTESTSIEVIINALPVADAGADQLITCAITEVPIGGNSSTGANITYLWELDGNPFPGDAGQLSQNVMTSGNYTLTVTNTDTGCFATDNLTIDLDDDMPEVGITISPIDCFGDDNGGIFIDNVTGGTPPYLYSFNGSPFTANTVYTGLMPGPYTIQVLDSNGCESEQANVTINQPNELDVQILAFIEGNTIIFGDSIEMELLVNIPVDSISTIQWSPPSFLSCDTCLQTIAQPLETATFSVAIEDVNGCRDTDQLQILVEKIRPVYIPNAFSPDGGDQNDIFMIYAGPQVTKVKSFLVYNRWGETVHQYYNFLPNNPTFGWDGSHKGQPLNPAVFVYWAEIEFVDGSTEIYKGDVTLMR